MNATTGSIGNLDNLDTIGNLGTTDRSNPTPSFSRAPSEPHALGVWGERFARGWLEQRGWSFLDANWQTRYGELDLVMLDPARTLVFVEVKTRRTTRYGTPQEAVTAHKRLALRRAGAQWLLDPSHRIRHAGVRFDVVALTVTAPSPIVMHITEAF